MLIRRKSSISGLYHTMDIPTTPELIAEWEYTGKPIQEIMPNLTADQREFLISGITPEEWEELFTEEVTWTKQDEEEYRVYDQLARIEEDKDRDVDIPF
jgi:hypothetical protein